MSNAEFPETLASIIPKLDPLRTEIVLQFAIDLLMKKPETIVQPRVLH